MSLIFCASCQHDLPELPSADVVQRPHFESGELAYMELAHRSCEPTWGIYDNWGREKPADEMLLGYEKCFVDGCWENAVVTAIHKVRRKPVSACACHNPALHGSALPFHRGPLPEPEPEQTLAEESLDAVEQLTPEQRIAELLRELIFMAVRPPQPPPPDDGMKARLQPPKPKLPPGDVARSTR